MCPTGAIHGVNFPKPLDKDAIKARIKARNQKAAEATTPSVAEKKVDAPSGVSPSAPAPVVANKKVDAPAGVPAANTKEGPKDE